MENEKMNLSLIIDSLEDSKAKNIKAIDIHTLTTIAHYFVIVSGTSVTHIKALNDNLVEKLSENGIKENKFEDVYLRADSIPTMLESILNLCPLACTYGLMLPILVPT